MRLSVALSLGLVVLGSGLFIGCDAPSVPARARIGEPQFLTFRCVRREPVDGRFQADAPVAEGLPLDGCGCTRTDEDGEVVVIPRVQCRCEAYVETVTDDTGGTTFDVCTPDRYADEACELRTIAYVRAVGECAPGLNESGGGCVADDSSGDWQAYIPTGSEDTTPYLPCEVQANGQLRGYVAATGRGEVAVLDISSRNAVREGSGSVDDRFNTDIIDLDRTIPGTTSVYVDDLISDIGAHPDGDFVFTVNSSSGRLSVITDDGSLNVPYSVDLGIAPLLNVAVTPGLRMPRGPERDAIARRAFISAPGESAVVEIDLEAVAQGEDAEVPIIVGLHVLPSGPGDEPPRPGRISVDPEGQTLFVAHLERPRVSAFPLGVPGAPRSFDVRPPPGCDDGYISSADDEDPECAPVSECADEVDNDGDGLVDREDPDCAADPLWEGETPACADGRDNDGDGLADRNDPDCHSDADTSEAGRERLDDPCSDGADNDGDGLVDADDPDCPADTCRDGVNNDSDSDDLTDDEDPDCRIEDGVSGGEDGDTCDDGIDNGGDGLVDRFDLDCRTEGPPSSEPCDGAECPGDGSGNEVCTDGVDNDADGLVDADDPGCVDFDAPLRYGFEVGPECANNIDDDGDGQTDFAGGDSDCYAASDSNEGTERLELGPLAIDNLRVEVVGRDGTESAHHFLYAADRSSGELVGLELDDALDEVGRTRIRVGRVMDFAARQLGNDAALITVGEDGLLRSVAVTAPLPLTDEGGRPVFARVQEDPLGSGEFRITTGYVVEDGTAWRVPALAARFEGVVTELDEAALEIDPNAEGITAGTMRSCFDDPEADGCTGDDGGTVDVVADRGRSNRKRGSIDPIVRLEGRLEILHDELNLRNTAGFRSNRLTNDGLQGGASLYFDTEPARFDPDRHPFLCRTEPASVLEETDETAPAACIPVGYESDGGREPTTETEERTRFRVDLWEGVVVTEEDPDVIGGGTFEIAYEGLLPRSDSRTGQFGGVDADNDTDWTLLDYESDFCSVGVEVGDVLLVERFIHPENTLCDVYDDRFQDLTARGERYREPLAYRVKSVFQHRIELTEEDRLGFPAQVTRSEQLDFPVFHETPAPRPTAECASSFIFYSLRAKNDDWLITREGSYRHPIVNRGGACEVDDGRVAAGRVWRTRLGELFENEWFRFRLGHLAADPEDDDAAGVPADALPHMVDARIEFTLQVGAFYSRIADVATLPRSFQWLSADDRLYVVDSAVGTVTIVDGLDTHRGEVMRLITQFD
jgi:hypothetical protein